MRHILNLNQTAIHMVKDPIATVPQFAKKARVPQQCRAISCGYIMWREVARWKSTEYFARYFRQFLSFKSLIE